MRGSIIQASLILIAIPLLANCGGDSSNEDTSDSVNTGVLVDSAIQGVDFETATQSGTTNSDGEFEFLAGETITFSIGSLLFPVVEAAAVISPEELGAGSADPSSATVNIARLFQPLDEDANPYNGIVVPGTAGAAAGPIDFDVSEAAFESDPTVINLVANSGSLNPSLISVDDTLIHLNQITEANFTSQVVGNLLILIDVNGDPDLTSQLTVNSNGTVTGFTPAGDLDLTWYWENGLFCRSGTTGSGTTQVPLDCQPVSMQGSILTFTRDFGAGISVQYEVE